MVDATTMDSTPENQFPEEQLGVDEFTLSELLDELDDEGLTEADLEAVDDIVAQYVGFNITVKRGPQSKGWPEDLKQAAIEAVGGGDTGSASMSDRLWPKGVAAIKEMGSALSALGRLKTDLYYTLPHPRTGLRRVRIGKLDDFKLRLDAAKAKIRECAEAMNDARGEIKAKAKKMLKDRYDDSFYNLDFTALYYVDVSWTDLGVPPALKQFADLRRAEAKRVKVESAKTIVMFKRVIAKRLQEMVDAAAERLEGRRLLDKKHEVEFIEKAPGDQVVVVYRDANVSKGSKPTKRATMTVEQMEKRVTDDDRRKHWQDSTMKRLIEETAELKAQMDQLGVGGEDLTPIFTQLQRMLRGQDADTINPQLKQSAGFREGLASGLVRVNNALLDLAVVKSERDIIRGRSTSRKINPNRS